MTEVNRPNSAGSWRSNSPNSPRILVPGENDNRKSVSNNKQTFSSLEQRADSDAPSLVVDRPRHRLSTRTRIPFASIDPTLDHLVPKLRTMVEDMCERKRLLGEVLHVVSATVQESRALVARSRGKPYVASRFGKSIIRDN